MNRSLRQDIRRSRLHVLRLLVVGVLFLLLVITHARGTVFAAPGLLYFRTIIWLNFSLITIAGVGFFATAITEEKEEMTLQLFVIAGIKPLAILIGKSFNRLAAALTILVVQIPFTMLAITLGGVKPVQITAAYVSLAAYLFLVANIGLLFSVICRRSGTAMTFTAATIGLFVAGSAPATSIKDVLAARQFIATGGIVDRCAGVLAQSLDDASVVTRIGAILKPNFNSPAVDYQVRFALAAGTLMFIAAWGLFNTFNESASDVGPVRGWVPHRRRFWNQFAPGRPWRDALAWKDFHFLIGGKPLIVARLLLIPLLTVGVYLTQYLENPWGQWWDINMTNLAGVSAVVLAAEMSIQASRIFSDEVRWRTLSNIAMLPQPISTTAYSKIRGCLLGLIPAVVWLFIGLAGASDTIFREIDNLPAWTSLLCYLAEFVLFLYITTYLSLVVRWGALPLALIVFAVYLSISTSYFSALLFGMLLTGSSSAFVALALYNTLAAAIIIGFLHAAIGRRLQAAQGY